MLFPLENLFLQLNAAHDFGIADWKISIYFTKAT